MSIPAGYFQLQSGFFIKTADNSGPYSVGSDGVPVLAGLGSNGSVFKTINAGAITADLAIWTPAIGKKFRLMGMLLNWGGTGGNVLLKDGLGGATIYVIPFSTGVSPVHVINLGQGIVSALANNALTVFGGVAAQTISGTVWGTEE